MDLQPTAYGEVIDMFHSMFKSKEILSDALEKQYFLGALAEYQLDVTPIDYDPAASAFTTRLSGAQVYTLALMMYTRYLSQELSRTLKLNGISGKDIQLTGAAASKQYTFAELQAELSRVNGLLYKQKQHCFN